MARIPIEFSDEEANHAGRVACQELLLLKKESMHGEIVLVIKDGRVIESHRKVSKHYERSKSS